MPITNLSQLVRAIRNGEVALDKESANQAMELASNDDKVARGEELDLLRDLADSAPRGTDFGRALLQNFVRDAQTRFSSAEFHLGKARELLSDDVGARLPERADYIKSSGLLEDVQGKTRDALVGREALLDLVKGYDLAYEPSPAPSLGVEDKIEPDVVRFYNDYVSTQTLPENDPLGPVRDYLEANYAEPKPDPGASSSPRGADDSNPFAAWLRVWGW